MQMIFNALLIAVLFPAAPKSPPAGDPACHAELKGQWLTTTIEFTDGYRLQAPWKVLSSQRLDTRGSMQSIVADLLLENLIEGDVITGEQQATPLMQPIRLRLEAQTEPELVLQAAQTWCVTVIQAQQGNPPRTTTAYTRPGRIT